MQQIKSKNNAELAPKVLDENALTLVLEPHERPKSIGQWIILSFQHVFAMFGSTVLVPMIINATATAKLGSPIEVMNISMALFCSGVGTLVYIACTKAKVPMYLGSSFAYMSAIGTNFPLYGNAVFIAIMVAGLIYILFGVVAYYVGTKFIETLLPAVVVGPIIIVIGIGVAPSAVDNAGLNATNWKEGYPAWLGIIIALFTAGVTMIMALKAKGFFKIVPILSGVIAGYLFAMILHLSNPDWGILNTKLLTDTSAWEWHPSFKKFWDVKGADIGPAIIAISPLALVAIAEHIGEHISLGYMTGKNFVKKPGMHRTLIADGISIVFDGLVGGPPNTTYGENTSVVGMTKVASVWVTGLAAIFAIILSFLAPVNQIILMMPKPVMGGISMIMFGLIAANGIRVLISNKIDYGNMRNVFITALILVLGLGSAVIKITTGASALEFNGVALAAFGGIILNLILPRKLNDGFYLWNWMKAQISTRKKTSKSKDKTPNN
ncbi:uracil permease [Entomoplasma freundtii]|uniref:Uracil permease n=1 Tax=Entomoplasma freundtii TaxID=74700 RepID=A0A2K8NRD0_9MOLU|nr:solute carrier family 23 protein [Entomoplasma freundtii]ATZ16096.1 uracil permease [Entomoplasma freundtii]TDY57003.1 uracil permease [Entomoplasma freundtii]